MRLFDIADSGNQLTKNFRDSNLYLYVNTALILIKFQALKVYLFSINYT